MDHDEGAWQKYYEVGENYNEDSNYIDFNNPAWYSEMGFNEYLFVMRDNHKRYYINKYDDTSKAQWSGWNVWFDYIIAGEN